MYQNPKIAFLLSFSFFLSITSGQVQAQRVSTVAFYNLENLFDTEDDPKINDRDFLPTGSYEWSEEKYQNKLTNLSKVIAQIGDTDGPEILGVSEVENRRVLEDLVSTPTLKPRKYQIVHQDTRDPRGIDVAILYKPHAFQPFEVKALQTTLDAEPNYIFRHHLMVTGLFHGKDTLTVIVCHWPSRRGGGSEKRNAAAQTVRKAIDSLDQIRPKAKVIVMGDFNDDPSNASIRKHLRCQPTQKKLGEGDLFNPLWQLYKQGFGSLKYQGTFNLFDQIILSQSMLSDNPKNACFYPNSQRIFSEPWLFQKDGPYAGYPLRTHAGGKYLNGYSDHLPVSILLYQ